MTRSGNRQTAAARPARGSYQLAAMPAAPWLTMVPARTLVRSFIGSMGSTAGSMHMAGTPYDESEVCRLETVGILQELPGGPELLDWFGGAPSFHDSEVISLCLDRHGTPWLRVAACKPAGKDQWDTIVVTMTLKDQVDLSIQGFSHQNVIGGLAIRSSRDDNPVHQSLLGVGITPPAHEIELEPCAGSFGVIRATVSSISLELRNDAFLWQR